MSKSAFDNSRILTFLERNTIRKNHAVIAVSGGVLADYEKIFKPNKHSFVLKNYIADAYFSGQKEKHFAGLKKIRLVAVGNIKKLKNYTYIVKAFEHLKMYGISCDIYGQGNDEEINSLKQAIAKNNLPIHLMGPANNINEVLPAYDIYVMSSSFEGFGIAAVEAMASGLPLLLSDLPILHEVTYNNALFFDLEDPMSFAGLIKEIFEGKHNLEALSKDGIDIAKKYTKEIYLKSLFSIYDNVLQITQGKA
jgi:glycosyltransferase involved in cell wall biosynthesis